MLRRRGRVTGVVQGVGFRPFVARLAGTHGLAAGFVRNEAGAVVVEVEGRRGDVEAFATELVGAPPVAARIDAVEWEKLPSVGGDRTFNIERSDDAGTTSLTIPPDLAVCPACLAEVQTVGERRYGYPFGSCTDCGPRYSIAAETPYDRQRTSMRAFRMCPACAAEYSDARDRRYHAQTVACPACGPVALLLDRSRSCIGRGVDAIGRAAVALGRGEIVALKGVGGYQLLVRADDAAAVARLRERKHRPAKPLAVLVQDLAAADRVAEIGDAERRVLTDPAAPIVLCPPRRGALAAGVSPGMPRVGVMLPATPLHWLIARAAPGPLVATSGNAHDEPICIDDDDALRRLGAVADLFLCHDRDIVRRCDDSVVDVVGGQMRVLRAGRGLAPLALPLPANLANEPPLLAVGGHLNNAPALACHGQVVTWPHVGDLDTPSARTAMTEAVADLERFMRVTAPVVAMDAHPDYASTMWASSCGRRTVAVQHHHAHVAACLAEHGVDAALGVAFDGVGYGDDGTAWGGEFLQVDPRGARRVAHLSPFPLPGGDAAARDGRRPLVGLCIAGGIDPATVDPGLARLAQVARSPRLSPITSSVGRLFDAVAALTGVCARSRFEGEAAMRLEALASDGAQPYPLAFDGPAVDWRPMLRSMLDERADPPRVASRFHASLVAAVVQVAVSQRATTVALTGGCFANQLFLAGATRALTERGMTVLTPRRIPPGDGGLAVGQAWVAIHQHTGTMRGHHVSGDSR